MGVWQLQLNQKAGFDMGKTPLISVVMPCYNCESYIEEAIKSILNQSFQDFELIIIDDNSTDGSVSLIERYVSEKVRLIRHTTNMGISRTLNDGIRVSNGDFIARMDSDDIADVHRLEEQVNAMLSDKDLTVLGTGVNVVDESGNFIYYHINPTEDADIRKAFASTFPIWPGSQMWRRNKLYEAGLFDERIPGSEDLELTLRLCLVGTARNLRSPLYTYRKNAAGEATLSVKSLMERVILARKAFILKNENDRERLNKLYDDIMVHYQKTRSRQKNLVSTRNKYNYSISVALMSLLYGNRDRAKKYLSKARELDSKAIGSLVLSVLIIFPPSIVHLLFKLNRVGKKYFYILCAGNASRYLVRK